MSSGGPIPIKVQALLKGRHLQIASNLRTISQCDLPDVFAALAAHAGFDPEPLRKALVPAGEPPDPRYPGIITLIQQARRDWAAYGERLVQGIDTLLREGKLLPMSVANEALLQELFRDNRTMIIARFAGRPDDLARYQRLVDAGLLTSTLTSPALIDVAFKLGHGLDMLSVHRIPTSERAGSVEHPPALAEVVRQALAAPPLTPIEHAAMGFAQRRGGTYIRRPIDQSENAAHRILAQQELDAIRAVTVQAIAERADHRTMARHLREATGDVSMEHFEPADVEAVRQHGIHAVAPEIAAAMVHRTLQSDFERIARTELHFAHAFGAYTKLKTQTAAVGMKDPLVYKFVAPRSCDDCKRIWGNPLKPNTYRLSYIEQREAAGGNFHLPHAEWGPVIGPIHPNCTEGTLQIYNEKLVNDINEAAEAILATYRR